MVKHSDPQFSQNMAIFKFSLIAPVIQGTLSESSASAYYRRVTAEPLTRPDGSQFHYSPKTLEKWTEQYQKGGLDALVPKERSDKGSMRVIPEEAAAEIFRIKEEFPRLGAVQIRLRLLEKGLMPASVSERTVQRFLKNNHLRLNAAVVIKDRKAFETTSFGEIWMADTCYFPYIKENGVRRRTYLMCIVDDHSRLIVGARLFYADTAINFQTLLKSAIATYGIPRKIYLDHGSAYENSQLGFICASLGCLYLHAPVRDGAAKAKVERTFGTLKTRWLAGLDVAQFSSLAGFNAALANAVRRHNLTVNSSTGVTPMDRYLGSQSCVKMPPSQQWLDECFMNRLQRKVKNDATLRFNKTMFDAPMHFIGQTVEVRFLPGDLENAYIYHEGNHYPLRITNKTENSRVKRQNALAVDYTRYDG